SCAVATSISWAGGCVGPPWLLPPTRSRQNLELRGRRVADPAKRLSVQALVGAAGRPGNDGVYDLIDGQNRRLRAFPPVQPPAGRRTAPGGPESFAADKRRISRLAASHERSRRPRTNDRSWTSAGTSYRLGGDR